MTDGVCQPWELPASGPAAICADRLQAMLPVLDTPRLTLRAPMLDDFATYAAIMGSERALHMHGPMSREDAYLDFTCTVAGWLLRGHGLWTVIRKDTGAVTGFVLVNMEPGDQEPELGFFLTSEAEGNGFATEAGLRLNPSYLPPFQLHYLAQHDPEGPWSAILDESAQALSESTPHGLPPDWLLVTDAGYRPDPETGTLGSYDAIRVFLWAGFEVPGLAVLDQYQQQLRPILGSVRELGWMPERWDVASGRLQGQGPPGFQFAIAPLLRTYGAGDLAQRIQLVGERSRHGALLGQPARYYDQVLALFAEGYRERRYQFDSKGRLKLQWHRDSRS